MLTNYDLVNFCYGMLGVPYWYWAPCVRATKNLYRVNALRFPEKYDKDPEIYAKHIADNEIVTDDVGLLKGFIWTNGGKVVLDYLDNPENIYRIAPVNELPDKTPNGLFTWVTTQPDVEWGEFNTFPKVAGLIVISSGHLGIYDGQGYVIEANEKAGKVIRTAYEDNFWHFWFQLPGISYSEKVERVDNSEIIEKPLPQLTGIATTITNVLFRNSPSEEAKFLSVIPKGTKTETYDDSDDKWIHLSYDEKEGYALKDYFVYYPIKPHYISSQEPTGYKIEYMGDYQTTHNINLKVKPSYRGNVVITIPKETQVYFTGGYIDEWRQVYVVIKDLGYVGYVLPQYFKKVSDVNGDSSSEKEDNT